VRDSLWWIVAPAAIWVGHFLVSYAMVAIACARTGVLGPVGPAFAVLTGVALAALVGTGLRGFRRYREVPPEEPEADSDIARQRFLALATALLSGLAVLGIGYVALSFAIIGACE
jgi:hypothetical protein